MKFYNLLILYRNKLVYPYVRILLNIVLWIAYLFSAALIGAVIYEHGFHVSASELQVLNTFYHVTWLVMLTNVLSHLFLGLKDMRMRFNIMTWVLTFLLLLTLIPVFFHRPLEEDVEKQLLHEAMARLPERDRLIIELRFGLRGEKELTQKEVADLLGISQSYISRLEKKIIVKLRDELQKMA